MKPSSAVLLEGLKSGIKAMVVAICLCFGIMILFQRMPFFQPLIRQVNSYNSHGVVLLKVLPNGLDLLGLALQLPYEVWSGSKISTGVHELNIQCRLHLLWLIGIPMFALDLGSKKPPIIGRPLRTQLELACIRTLTFTSLTIGFMAANKKQISFQDLPTSGLMLSGRFNLWEGFVVCFLIVMTINLWHIFKLNREQVKVHICRWVNEEVYFACVKYIRGAFLSVLILNIGLSVCWVYLQINGTYLIDLSFLSSNSKTQGIVVALMTGGYAYLYRLLTNENYWSKVCVLTGVTLVMNYGIGHWMNQYITVSGKLNIMHFLGIPVEKGLSIIGIKFATAELIVLSLLLSVFGAIFVYGLRMLKRNL